MKLSLLKPIIALLPILLTFNLPFAGTLHTWTDENGVIHMTTQPPPKGIEHEKTKYKNPPVLYQNKTRRLKYNPNNKINREERERNANIRKRELQEKFDKIDQDHEKSVQKIELESAKRNYEFLKGQEEKYRAYYHEANTTHYRNYWYEKIKSVDEARSKYIRLKNKYGQ